MSTRVYRARFDGPKKGLMQGMFLSADREHVGGSGAFCGPLSAVVNGIAWMVEHETRTVAGGTWTIERKVSEWEEVK